MNATTKSATRVGGWKQSAAAFWNDRNQRERRMLAAAAAVVVLGLIYALLIDPALSGRGDLEKRLPALRQQAAEVQALAKQARDVPAAPAAAAPATPMTRESLETALSRKGLKAQNLSVTGELAKVQLNGVPFSALVDWLVEMQGAPRVSVLDANIEAQAQPDTVNATLTLRQQRGEQAR
ncbi:MAG TPA: type II secretion system protein GspM [Noviherbaspirillum sp.]|jgi:general secretion pathway protein M|uniref:type II secretion system protein GspM n=1 Tax=Noviherbaspirillum sp. TaxID=1926288 RepID=UPI002F92F77E